MKKVSNVFWIAVVIVVIAVTYGALAPESFEQVTTNMKDFITSSFGWYYLLVVTGIVLFCLFFIVSPMGQITLGKPDEEPEYSRMSWFAMLFFSGNGDWTRLLGCSRTIIPFRHQPCDGTTGNR